MSGDYALSAKDICAIVSACAKGSVQKLDYAGLSVTFHKQSDVVTTTESIGTTYIPYSLPPETPSQIQSDIASPPPETQEELEMQLALENPVEWERRQLGED